MASLPGPLWFRVVEPDRILSIGQIELFDYLTVCKQMTVLIKLFVIHSNVCKQMIFKNVINKIYMYKENLALNN